jgi:hypothetical protein
LKQTLAINASDSSSPDIIVRIVELEKRLSELEARSDTNGELLSTAQVCKLLNIHANTWYGWLKRFPKPPMAIGSPSNPRYRKSSVLRFASRVSRFSNSGRFSKSGIIPDSGVKLNTNNENAIIKSNQNCNEDHLNLSIKKGPVARQPRTHLKQCNPKIAPGPDAVKKYSANETGATEETS